MKPLFSLIASLLIAANASAEIRYVDGTTGQTNYARIKRVDGTFVAVALPEGSTSSLRNYVATDAAILSASGGAGTLPAGTLHFTVRRGSPSTTADDALIGGGLLPWDGSTEIVQTQTGDSFARLGAPTGASIAADIAASSSGSNPVLLQSTTIATLASQTSFTLTAGSADNDAYNNGLAILTDQSTSTQKSFSIVSDYVGSTRTVTLLNAPAFTIATGDSISIVANANSANVAAFLVGDDDTWTFDSRDQITSPDILTESVGEPTILKAFDFSRALGPNGSIGSITSVTVADVSGATEPLIVKSEISPDKKKVFVTINATSATAATFTFTGSVVSSDNRTPTRKGKLNLQ